MEYVDSRFTVLYTGYSVKLIKLSNIITGTVYETFMKLQWAVDSGYLKILGDRDIPEVNRKNHCF